MSAEELDLVLAALARQIQQAYGSNRPKPVAKYLQSIAEAVEQIQADRAERERGRDAQKDAARMRAGARLLSDDD